MDEIILQSGKLLNILEITEQDIDIYDICYSLSNIARFSGQVPFYSVARHSIYVSQILPHELKLSGLLHDASEAYIGDVVSPIKHKMKEYLELEKNIMTKVSKKWNLDINNPLVKRADMEALVYEKNILFFKKEYRIENQKEIMDKFMSIYVFLLQEN